MDYYQKKKNTTSMNTSFIIILLVCYILLHVADANLNLGLFPILLFDSDPSNTAQIATDGAIQKLPQNVPEQYAAKYRQLDR